MSKSMGIKIKIDYSDVNELKSALKDKIPVEIDDKGVKNALKSIERRMKGLKSNNRINLTMNTAKAKAELNAFKTTYENLKKEVESGMAFKLDFSKALTDNSAINIKKNLEESGFSVKKVQKQVDKMVESLSQYNGTAFDKLKISEKLNSKGEKNIYQTLSESIDDYTTKQTKYVNGAVKEQTVTENRLKALQDIARVTKELYGLEQKQLTADQFDSGAISKQIEVTRNHLNELKESWSEITGLDANSMSIVKMAESTGEYNLKIKEAAQARQEQNRIEKETASQLKEVIALENEKHAVLMKSQKADTNEKQVLDNRAQAINNEISSLKEKYSLEAKLTQQQRDQLTAVEKSNATKQEYTQNLAQAQAKDKAVAEEQMQTYKSLEASMKEYYSIREKMSELESKESIGTINSKEESKLQILQKQLDLVQEISDASIKQNQEQGKITQAQSESLQALQKTKTARLNDVQSLSKQKAELQKIDAEYDKLKSSMKQVADLEVKKASAGKEEASVIDELIAKERERQSVIRETISLSGQKNAAAERELDALKDTLALETKNKIAQQQSRSLDTSREVNSTDALLGLVSAHSIYYEGKQAFQYLYRNIKELDDAMIDVKKVADASEAEFATFERTIFNHASAVGKTASEYAISVERWAAAGYNLQSAVKMAEFSTMGAFVGNIGEADMVDYMSVPLIAYEEFNGTTLQAWDILNAMNEVANNNAVEMDTLGAAYKRAASTAANAGTSFAELTGLIGAAETATRLGGETIGTSFRTMDINISKIASRDTKGFEAKFDFFKDIGVDIIDTNGELNSTYDILGQLQGAWGDLDTVTRTQAGMNIAGARGQAVITALMSNWEEVQKMVAESEGQIGLSEGTGSMYDELETQQDSMAFKQAQLQNSWGELIQVVTGGKGVFMDVMDVAIQAIEKLTEWAENDDIVDGVTKAVTGVGAFVTAIAGMQAMRFTSKMVGDLAGAFLNLGEAGKRVGNLKTIITSGGGLKAIIGSLLTPFGKFAIVTAAVTAGLFGLGKILDHFGYDLWGRLSTGFSDSAYAVKEFGERQQELLDTLGESQNIYKAIDQADQLAVSYANLLSEKEAAAAASGDYTMLKLDEQEYNNFMSQHNALVEELELDKDLKITFNNADHITSQIRNLNNQLDDLEVKRMKLDAQALSEGMSGIDPNILLDNYLGNYNGEYEDVLNRLLSINLALNDARRNPGGNKEKIEALEAESRTLRLSNEFKKGLKEFYSEDEQGWIESREEFEKFYDSYIDRVNESSDPVKMLTEALRSPDIKGMPGMFFRIMDSIAQTSLEAESFGSVQGDLNKVFGEFGYGNTGKDAVKQIQEIESKYGELLSSSNALNDWYVNNGMDPSAGLNNLLNADEALVRSFIDHVLPGVISDVETQSQNLEEAVIGMAENFDISTDKARELIAKSKSDRGGFIRDLFGLDGVSHAAAAEAIGIGNMELVWAENLVKGSEQSVGSLIQNIHNSISELEGEDFQLAVKANIVTESGDVDYNRILDDLSGFDREFLVQIGVEAQDGTLDDIDNLYQALGMIGQETAAEIGVSFNAHTGMVDFENLKDKMESGEVVISPTLDPNTGEVISMEISSMMDNGEYSTITVDADTEPAKSKVAKLMNEEYKESKTVYVDVEPTYREGDQTATDNYLRDYLLGGHNAGIINIEAIPNLIIDGEINAEAVAQALQIPEEVEKDIRLKLNISEGEPLDLSNITDYLDLKGDELGHTSEEFIEFVANLLPSLKVKKPEVTPEELLEDEFSEEIEEDIEVTLNPVPKIGSSFESITSSGGGTGLVPDKIETVWNIVQQGEVTPETINTLVNNMPESIQTQYGINIGDSAETLEQINNVLNGMDTEQQVNFLANVVGIEDVQVIQELIGAAQSDVESTVSVNAETSELETANQNLDATDGKVATATVDANKTIFDIVMGAVDASIARYRKTTVYIHGDARHYNRVIDSLKTKSVTINIEGSKSSSQAIGAQLGASFSASVGSGVFGLNRSSSAGVGRSASKETKVNEDVWRYWGKELFTGLPIEKSLDDLNNELKKNADNQDQLIKLYKQQMTLIDKQIAHEKDMQKAQQEELTHIISQLQKHGFTASGNKITNLDRSKSLSGDTATEVEGLLNEWKKLYESLDSIDKNIAKLDLDKYNAKEDIRQAEIKKELERLEERMKASEALLRAVDNNTSIQNTKENLVGGQDYDLVLAIKEQGLNTANASIGALLKNYNQLATTIVEYEENAEEIQETMESLRDSILENADAVIEYREEMNSIQLDRLIGDFESFNAVMARNADALANNIEQMKEGLLSGQSLSDLEAFGTLDINRKTKLERDYELRLELEAELNKSLEEYANKNIERTKSVADAVLKIESQKYSQLLEMSKSFNSGQAVQPFEFDNIGIGSSTDTSSGGKSGLYNKWKSELEALTNAYSTEYLELVSKHEKAIDGATSSLDKQALNQKAILDQLSLQEKLYKDMIVYNNKFISQAEEELKNTSLTTEQRNQLLDAIEEYRLANTEAQQSIRGTVASRFDYEFTLLDKAASKVEGYVSSLEHLLNVAELVNMDATQVSGLYEAIYQSKVNQYSSAKDELESLLGQQAEFEEGSYEWNLLNERIEEVSDSLKDFGVNALNANHDVLSNALDSIQEKFERGILDGKTLEEWKEYNEQWLSGMQKQLSLEDLRIKALNVEDDIIKSRLEMLDRQEKVSQKDVDYMDKQLKVMELQGKLNNLSQERNVQTLVRDAEGRWGLGYDFDQTEYDKTQSELRDAQKELEKYRSEQRQSYADSLGTIVGRANDGSYSSTSELEAALNNLQSVYGMILDDIPDLGGLSFGEILSAYEKYLVTNSLLANDIVNPTNNLGTQDTIKSIGAQFETSFMKISSDFGKVIGDEVKEVLRELFNSGSSIGGGNNTYYIDNIEFPHVTAATEIQQAIAGLRDTANQMVNKKV